MAGALVAAAHSAHQLLHANSDTGCHSDRLRTTPLGLGCCTDFRRGNRAAGFQAGFQADLLKRRFLSNGSHTSTSSSTSTSYTRATPGVYMLYRHDFEQKFLCRSQVNPNLGAENTDVEGVANSHSQSQSQSPGEDHGILSQKPGLPSSSAGANGAPNAVHMYGSLEKILQPKPKLPKKQQTQKQKQKQKKLEEEEERGVVAAIRAWLNTIPRRYIIVGLCFIAFLLCNMDRVNMSIAILPMSSDYKWSPSIVGLVQSSFFWGYLLTQIAGGIWADRIGGKQVLGFGVIWWSLATMATPIAAKIGLPALLFVRACMGVGEGVAMPAMNNLLSRWVPVRERSRSLALVYSGMYLGSVTGLAFSPGLIHKYSWPSVFFTFGSLGALWFFAWQKNAFSSPAEDPNISEEEKKLILGDSESQAPVKDIPWKLLLSKAPVWALIVCHFCHNWGTFILLTWMPTYYNQVLGFNLTESGLFSVLPWLTMALSANLGGWIADTLVSRGVSVTLVRKVMQSIGFLCPAFFLSQLSHIKSPGMAVACMMCSQGFDAFSQSGLYSNHQDIGPRYSGVLLGMSNTAGVLAGVLGTAATGFILQNGSWDDVFKVAVGLYLFGTVVWNLFSSGEKVFD